jgi:hypothetical protein
MKCICGAEIEESGNKEVYCQYCGTSYTPCNSEEKEEEEDEIR